MFQQEEGVKNSLKIESEVKPLKRRNFFVVLKDYLLLFIFTTILEVLVLKFIPPRYTPLMWIRAVEKVFAGERPVLKYEWKSYSNISDNAKLAILSSEDQTFPDHFGLDLKELKKAYSGKTKKNKRIRGASTISQQVAKNVFLVPTRSYIRKGFELYYTFLIELIWGKRKILETYLNVVEMGDGIYGVEAASEKYFKKEAGGISKSESAAIAAILPNPRKYSVKNPSPYINKRKNWIRRQMNSLGPKFLEKME
jgi:monofunctional glycosyltransferase